MTRSPATRGANVRLRTLSNGRVVREPVPSSRAPSTTDADLDQLLIVIEELGESLTTVSISALAKYTGLSYRLTRLRLARLRKRERRR